jgi:hypothetical protein
VQCNWGARHLVNAKDGQHVSSSSASNNGASPPQSAHNGHSDTSGATDNLRYEYDDHYFMTDPEVRQESGTQAHHVPNSCRSSFTNSIQCNRNGNY